MDDKANRRRRGAWLGLLLGLLLALGGYAYAQSSSPSASAWPDRTKPSATPTAQTSTQVSPPTQTAKPSAPSSSGSVDLGTSSTGQSLVLAPQTTGNGNGNGNNPCLDPASDSLSCPHTFGVRVGAAPLLYPGVQRSLPVTFSNPNNFAIAVSSYRVSVSTASTTCPASNLEVPSGTVLLNPGVAIAKNSSTPTTVPIQLLGSAPDACQRAAFSITVDATAVKK